MIGNQTTSLNNLNSANNNPPQQSSTQQPQPSPRHQQRLLKGAPITGTDGNGISPAGHPIIFGFVIPDTSTTTGNSNANFQNSQNSQNNPTQPPQAKTPAPAYGVHNNHPNAVGVNNNPNTIGEIGALTRAQSLPLLLNLTPLTVEEQVSRLITEATSLDKLCQCYIGWCYYM
jgi:hypothetical protein